jgi:hypothetical protein
MQEYPSQMLYSERKGIRDLYDQPILAISSYGGDHSQSMNSFCEKKPSMHTISLLIYSLPNHLCIAIIRSKAVISVEACRRSLHSRKTVKIYFSSNLKLIGLEVCNLCRAREVTSTVGYLHVLEKGGV